MNENEPSAAPEKQPTGRRELAARSADGCEESSAAQGAAKRVLVIDDEAVVRDVLVRTFRRLGYEVAAAPDPGEAVKAFLKGRFDLITLDIDMPGMSGLDLHRVLSQEFGIGKRVAGSVAKKLPPILVITGFADRLDVSDGQFGEGIVGVLSKPLDIDTLARTVRCILDDG